MTPTTLSVPSSIDSMRRTLNALANNEVIDQPLADMIKRFIFEESRRSYLEGQRAMRNRAENALASLSVDAV